MPKFFLSLLLLIFLPTTFLSAQDDGGYYEDDGYYDDGSYASDDGGYYEDDGYYDDGSYASDDGGYYEDDGYYDDGYTDEYADSVTADQTSSVQASASADKFKWFRLSTFLRGGWQGSVENSFANGFVGELGFNIDLSYVYAQIAVGWSRYWAQLGINKYYTGGAGSVRSSSVFNEGWYLGVGGGFVVPQIGLRIGGGVQMTMELMIHSFDVNYSNEIVPYVEASYEWEFYKNLTWMTDVKAVLTGTTFSSYLPKTGAKTAIELQTGISYYFL